MFALHVDQWFKPGPSRQEIKVGAVFQSIRRGNIIETAKVLDIMPDCMGVTHVHYKVSLSSSHHECFEEQRTLGLATFVERFSKALTA